MPNILSGLNVADITEQARLFFIAFAPFVELIIGITFGFVVINIIIKIAKSASFEKNAYSGRYNIESQNELKTDIFGNETLENVDYVNDEDKGDFFTEEDDFFGDDKF